MKFKVTWSTGVVEYVEISDCQTVEQYAVSAWGYPYAQVQGCGVTVEIVDEWPDSEPQTTSDTDVDEVPDDQPIEEDAPTGGDPV